MTHDGVAGSLGATEAPGRELPRWLSYVELVVAMSLWGSLYPAGKPVLAAVPAAHVALVRAVVAWVVLSALVLARGKGREALAELTQRPWSTAVLGSLSFFLSSLLAMLALSYLPASVVGLISNTSPLWLSLGAIALHRPKDSGRMLVGAAIALAGVALVLFRQEADAGALLGGGGLDPRGVALALLCSGVIAVQAAWGRRVMPGRDPMVMTALACLWSVPPLALLAQAEGGVAPLLATTLPLQALLLYLGVGCTAVNFALFNHVLQRVPAERASAFQYLTPLVSALLAFALLGEPATWPLVVGGAAILAGIWLTQERRGPREQPAGQPPVEARC